MHVCVLEVTYVPAYSLAVKIVESNLFSLQLAAIFILGINGAAVEISAYNYEEYKASREILFFNFYADWCRFSQQLKPVFDKAAATLHAEFPNQVLLGKVNCDRERDFCTNPFHISKYPTLKLIRNGEITRREYRGQRSVDALVEFMRKQLSNPVETIEQYYELAQKDVQRAIVGYFATNTAIEYTNFEKAARSLRDDCPFYALLGQEHGPQVAFHKEGSQDIAYTGDLSVFDQMMPWIQEQCVPLVREITFANGEELTEEGLPLLLLFYSPDDTSTKDLFKQRVEAELLDQKGAVNFVIADGVMFAHPLHHLGKSKRDLPLIAIDSFRHMYLFPDFEDIR